MTREAHVRLAGTPAPAWRVKDGELTGWFDGAQRVHLEVTVYVDDD